MQDGTAEAGASRPQLAVTAGEIAELQRVPPTGTVTIGGVALDAATGSLLTGRLDPAAEPLELPAEVAGIVRPADEALDLAAINANFNPFAEQPTAADGRPLIGPYSNPGRVYTGKVVIPLRELARGALSQVSEKLANALSEHLVFETPAHQFNVPWGIGNRVVFYGGTIGHSHLDQLTFAMSARHMRLLKAMTQVAGTAQGGSLIQIVEDAVGGTTHLGALSAGYSPRFLPVSVKSDWPSSYLPLGDAQHEMYNAHILAIDYAKGTHDPIPEDALAAYGLNADMWDAVAGLLVPFTSDGEIDFRYGEYKYNPLEVYDQQSAGEVAQSLARLDEREFLTAHGAFYCAEGQFCVANLGPQESTLLKRSRFGGTRLGQLIDNFAKAPEFGGEAEIAKLRPRIGWEHLKELGPQKGGISAEQFKRLDATDRLAIPLVWIDEKVSGWQAYRPKNSEGLVARPMTVATMAWSLFRRYLPREALARALVGELTRLAGTAPELKQAIAALAGGAEPAERIGRMAISLAASRLAAHLIRLVLSKEEARKQILKQAGYGEMPLDADRKALEAVYDDMLKLVVANAGRSQEEFDKALLDADRKVAAIRVSRAQTDKTQTELIAKLRALKDWYDKPAELRASASPEERNAIEPLLAEEGKLREAEKGLYVVKPGTPMVYAAPNSFVAWAQQPFLADTGCIRYVATAMHVNQSRDYKPGTATAAGSPARAGVTGAAEALGGKTWSILGQTYVQKGASEGALAWYGLVPPGAGMPAHVHPTQDAHIYVLDGKLSIRIDGVERVLGSADLAQLPRGVVRAFVNRGEAPVHAMFWVSPSRRLGALFDKLHGLGDPAVIQQIAAEHEMIILPSG